MREDQNHDQATPANGGTTSQGLNPMEKRNDEARVQIPLSRLRLALKGAEYAVHTVEIQLRDSARERDRHVRLAGAMQQAIDHLEGDRRTCMEYLNDLQVALHGHHDAD